MNKVKEWGDLLRAEQVSRLLSGCISLWDCIRCEVGIGTGKTSLFLFVTTRVGGVLNSMIPVFLQRTTTGLINCVR